MYCLNVPGDGEVVNSTALMGRGGGRETCLVAAHLAASFHILPDMAFSDRRLVNSLITAAMHSEVSPAFWLSQWRIFSSSSIPSVHSGHAVGALNRIQPSLLFGKQFYLSRSKLDLFSDKTDCLGHVIDDNGIHAELDKMRQIREWRIP